MVLRAKQLRNKMQCCVLHCNSILCIFQYSPRVLTISVCIPKASAFKSGWIDLEDYPKIIT